MHDDISSNHSVHLKTQECSISITQAGCEHIIFRKQMFIILAESAKRLPICQQPGVCRDNRLDSAAAGKEIKLCVCVCVWEAHQRVNGHSLEWCLFSAPSPLSWSRDLFMGSVHWSRNGCKTWNCRARSWPPQQPRLNAPEKLGVSSTQWKPLNRVEALAERTFISKREQAETF